MIIGNIFKNWNKTCYIANKIKVLDKNGNEINDYDVPVKYKMNIQPVSTEFEINEYGEKVYKKYEAIVPYHFKNKVKEGDIAYLNGQIPINYPKTLSGKGQIDIVENIPNGKITEIRILGDNKVFNLFPSKKIFPGKKLIPSRGKSILEKINGLGEKEEIDLQANGVLRKKGFTYDELIYKNGECKVIRRINGDGTKKEYPEENITKTFQILLKGENNIIKIKDSTSKFEIKYTTTKKINNNFVVSGVLSRNLSTVITFTKVESTEVIK